MRPEEGADRLAATEHVVALPKRLASSVAVERAPGSPMPSWCLVGWLTAAAQSRCPERRPWICA